MVLVNTKSWSVDSNKFTGHVSAVSFVQWSPNGDYLASLAKDQIYVFEIENRGLVSKCDRSIQDDELCQLSWHPKQNAIAFVRLHCSVILLTLILNHRRTRSASS